MAKPFGGKRPQDLRHTLRRFMDYLGRHKIMLGVVGLLAAASALAALLGTYMIRPIVNGVLENGSAAYLAGVVALTAGIYIVGALSTLGYTQLMVRAAQKILQDIRRDLFAHLQTLPLHYFDTNRKGDLMSLFTNDVDTISDALNNSFAVVIQTFIQVAGTLLLLFVLNWRLSLLVVVGYIAMFWYINYSTQRSRAFYARQQASLGELDAYMEEMIAGQKVVKVFNHQQADMAAFAARNEKLREAGTGAQSYAATMIPAVVSIGYLNYAVIAVVGGLMVMWGWSDLGSLASYLVFVRQTTLPINQLTQQGNFLLAALAGAERIFTVMEEKPEIDEGTVELVSVRENSDGTLTECAGNTGRWAWCDRRRPDVPLEPLHGDVRFHDVSFGYTPDRMILQNLSLYAKPGQKIAFVGSYGIAATTLFQILAGEMEPDEGDYKWGITTSNSYFPKDNTAYFDSNDTIVDWLMPFSPEKDATYVRGFLGRMLFKGDDGLKKVNVLSGGEKVRVMLSKMMMLGSNVLLMDEPTNHLDMESITSVNNGLIKFPGVVLFTSQDHQFIQTIANRIIEFTPNGMIDKVTTYDEYLDSDEMARKRQALS